MVKEDVYSQRSKVDNKISELTKQRNELNNKITQMKKKEEEKRKKQGERFYGKICKIYTDLLGRYDIEEHIHYEYWEDCEDGDSEMMHEITDGDYDDGFYATELNWNTKEIIDKHIKDAKVFAQAMNNHVKMLEEFKKEVLNKEEI